MEEEVRDMQEVRGSNHCKSDEIRKLFGSSQLTIAKELHNLTVFHRKIMYKFAVKKQLFAAYLTFFPIFPQPGQKNLRGH